MTAWHHTVDPEHTPAEQDMQAGSAERQATCASDDDHGTLMAGSHVVDARKQGLAHKPSLTPRLAAEVKGEKAMPELSMGLAATQQPLALYQRDGPTSDTQASIKPSIAWGMQPSSGCNLSPGHLSSGQSCINIPVHVHW